MNKSLREIGSILIAFSTLSAFVFFWVWFPINLSIALETELQSQQIQTLVKGQIGGSLILSIVIILAPIMIITSSLLTVYSIFTDAEYTAIRSCIQIIDNQCMVGHNSRYELVDAENGISVLETGTELKTTNVKREEHK